MGSVSSCEGLDDINSSVEKRRNGDEGRQMDKCAPSQGKEKTTWLSKNSLGFWTTKLAADGM